MSYHKIKIAGRGTCRAFKQKDGEKRKPQKGAFGKRACGYVSGLDETDLAMRPPCRAPAPQEIDKAYKEIYKTDESEAQGE